jgi:Flp pilus assembly protein TadD
VDKALKLYERAVQKNPNNLPATVKLAELYATETRDPAKALQMAKAARNLAPNDPEIAHTLGRLVFQAGDFAWSLALLQESQRKQAKNPELLYDLGLSYCAAGKVSDAESCIRNALAISTDFGRATAAQRTTRLLSAYLHPESALQFKDLAEETLRGNPDDLPALLAKATIQMERKESEAARETFEMIAKRYPLFTPASKPLAVLYARPDGDAQKAYDYAVKARAAFPGDTEVAKTLGILAYSRKDFARAVQLLKETAIKRPDDSEVFYYLGMTQYQLKQKSEAQQALQKALALKLDAKSAQEANRVLAELK